MTNLIYLPLAGVMGDNGVLSSKTNNGKPNRYLLAFFVRDNRSAPLADDTPCTKSPIILSQGNTIISKLCSSLSMANCYDGFTRPNTIPFEGISRDSFCWAIRDEPITLLLNFNNAVNFSKQNQQGGSHNA